MKHPHTNTQNHTHTYTHTHTHTVGNVTLDVFFFVCHFGASRPKPFIFASINFLSTSAGCVYVRETAGVYVRETDRECVYVYICMYYAYTYACVSSVSL